MSKNENEKDYYIKIDDIDASQQDYYIKIDNGDIIEKDRLNNQLDIMNENIQSESEYIPHYNSPEYAEYISKLNKDSLKEISMESVNNDNIALKIKDEAKKKYSKKQIQIFIFALILVLFIASMITVGFMAKSVSQGESTSGIIAGSSAKDLEDFDFLASVVVASNKNSVSNYDKLKEYALSKSDVDSGLYNIKIEEVKKLSQKDLDEVSMLKDYINVENYSDITSLLELRYENTIALCDEMILSNGNDIVSTYNKYTKVEIDIIDTLNKEFMKKLDQFNIPYELKDGAIVLND